MLVNTGSAWVRGADRSLLAWPLDVGFVQLVTTVGPRPPSCCGWFSCISPLLLLMLVLRLGRSSIWMHPAIQFQEPRGLRWQSVPGLSESPSSGLGILKCTALCARAYQSPFVLVAPCSWAGEMRGIGFLVDDAEADAFPLWF